MSDDELYECISYDPGGTTGWGVITVWREAIEDPEYLILENITHWAAGEFVGPWESQVDQMLDLADAWPSAKIVCEDFYLRQLAVDLSPVRVTAGFEYGLRVAARRTKRGVPRPVIKQMPSLAMTTVTDDRLKAWGFWEETSGKPHARDALRHGITWLRRAKEILSTHRVT